MQYIIINLLLLVSVVIGLIAAFLILNAGRKQFLNKILASLLFSACVWGGSIFLTIRTGNPFTGNISFAAGAISAGLILLSILSFEETFVENDKKRQRNTIFILTPAIILGALSLIGGILVKRMVVTDLGNLQIVEPGPLLPYFSLIVGLYFITAFIASIFIYNRQSSSLKKLQLTYVLIGLLIGVGLGSFFNLFLPLVLGNYQLNNLGPISVVLVAAIMAYAATKHYIYDTQVVLSELWTLLLSLVAFVWLVINFQLFNTILFLLIISLCILFVRSVLSEARKKLILEMDKKKLQELDRMKNEFIQMSTHELNEPISIIEGRLSMILDENLEGFSQEQKNRLIPVYEQAKRLALMNRRIIEVNQLNQAEPSLNKTSIDINDLIVKTIEEKRAEAVKRNQEIVFENYDLSLPVIKVDIEKIKTILEALIDNAMKFSKKGQTITVSARVEKDNLIVQVEDKGVGMSLQDQPHIFEKFFQAQRFSTTNPTEQQGTGLSLYIAKRYAELHRGKMAFTSEKDKGSVFSFSLPLS